MLGVPHLATSQSPAVLCRLLFPVKENLIPNERGGKILTTDLQLGAIVSPCFTRPHQSFLLDNLPKYPSLHYRDKIEIWVHNELEEHSRGFFHSDFWVPHRYNEP